MAAFSSSYGCGLRWLTIILLSWVGVVCSCEEGGLSFVSFLAGFSSCFAYVRTAQ